MIKYLLTYLIVALAVGALVLFTLTGKPVRYDLPREPRPDGFPIYHAAPYDYVTPVAPVIERRTV